MTKLLDKICFVRDLLISDKYEKLKFYKMEIYKLKEEIYRQVKKKSQDYSYNLDFTSQDLRELAQDIRNLLKTWEGIMSPDDNIKELLKNMKNNQIDINPFYEKIIPIMIARMENIQPLIELLNIAECHAVFLYMLEEASNDNFALKYTERF